MKRSNRLVLLVGIFLAVVAFILIAILLGGQPTSNGDGAAATKTNIVVAARDIAAGTTIASADLTTKEIAIADKPPTALTEPAVAIGQVARQKVTKDQLITAEIWESGGSVKVLEVPPGKVGISVRVDQVSGIGTVIKPGDYVDAVVAFNIPTVIIDEGTGIPAPVGEGLGPGTSVKTLLQGMQVLGTLLPPPPAPAANATPAPSGATSLNEQQQIVILAATLQQAEVLNYAQLEGAVVPGGVTLVLRSLQDFQDAAGEPSTPPDTVTTGIILSLLIEQYGVLVPDFGSVQASPAP